jgi:hypothetical protein
MREEYMTMIREKSKDVFGDTVQEKRGAAELASSPPAGATSPKGGNSGPPTAGLVCLTDLATAWVSRAWI